MKLNRYTLLSTLVLSIILCMSGRSQAQSSMTIALQAGIPAEQFAQNLQGDAAFGLNMEYLRRIRTSPLSVGVGMNIMGYGSENWNEYWAIGESVVDADYSVESCIFDVEGRARMEIPLGLPVLPYLHGFAGVSMLSTTFTVEDNTFDSNDCNGNVIYEETLSEDVTAVYGGGFGLMVPICGNAYDSPLFIDLGLSYRNSGQAEYMNRDMDRVFTSRTDMWLVRFGITFRSF